MAKFNMQPRERHFDAVLKIMGYFKQFYKRRLIFDTFYQDHSHVNWETHDWNELYFDAEKELLYDMPVGKGKLVKMTVYVDANHAHDLVTKRSVTEIIIFLNNIPVKWISKRQKTVETFTYRSKLVATKITVETIIGMRYQLKMLSVNIDGLADMFGDNKSVVLNTTILSSVLKKKKYSLYY